MTFEVVGISVQHLTGVAFQMILQYYWLFGIDHDVMRFGIGDESLQLKRDISNFGDIQSGMILFLCILLSGRVGGGLFGQDGFQSGK